MHRSFDPRPPRVMGRAMGILLVLIILSGWFSISPNPQPARADSSSLNDLTDLESRFKSIAEKVSPAVVAISASTIADNSPAACRCEELSSDKLQAFLSKTTRMVGTGFIIDPDGYILTNDHVIDDAEQLWITTDDRKVYPAIVVGSDPRGDLAVLKIPGHKMPTVHMGDGSAVHRGQWSIAIGNPYGLSGDGGMCLSVGVISAINRSLPRLSESENRLYANLIQTTAQINPGNSGGPLLDLHGDVIGINTAVIMPQKSINGIGFALPIDAHMLDEISKLKLGTEITHAYLGVIVSNPSEHDRQAAGLTGPIGVRVDSTQHDSPACPPSGPVILQDDIITRIDRRPIADSETFVQTIGNAAVTKPIRIDLLRDGKPVAIELTLRKRESNVPPVTLETQRLRWAGMLLGPEIHSGRTSGLLVLDINTASPFVVRGIHEGTVIRSVAGKSIHGLMELQNVINETPVDRCDFVTAPEAATADLR